MKSNILFAFFMCSLFVMPGVTQAYFSTAQSAIDVGDGYALFTVTYEFGFLNREVYMPILAKRNKDFDDQETSTGYNILFNDKTEATVTSTTMSANEANVTLNYSVLPGRAEALVLSTAEIKNGRYFIPKGKSAEFTLVALVDLRNVPNPSAVSLIMTSLPFTMIDKGTAVEARLNPSELKYYKTPTITLKK